MKYRDLQERLIANSTVDPETGCWVWYGHIEANGYGKLALRVDGKPKSQWAHRVSYECFMGKIPEGMTLDHLCRQKACIHPNHLEPVSNLENQRRRHLARRSEHD